MSEIKDELARRASGLGRKDSGNGPDFEEEVNGMECEKAFVRLLRVDEIECRVSTINERGLSLLLFKDARVDQKILDETFTPFGWKRTHQMIDGNLYCTVEIWDEGKRQWIAKQDVGTTSYSEKEKGQASDSFKRACFNWGVGRELYTAPFIWIPADRTSIQRKGDRYVTSDRFSVQAIAYNGQREIEELVIVNGQESPVYELRKKKMRRQRTNTETNQDAKKKQNGKKSQEITGNNITGMQMTVLEKELKRTGVSMEAVLERYQLKEPGQMTPEIYTKALNGLKKSKTKDAA